ncbi:hypothetical protein ABPG74_016543 [Tetrahymena malaccensis]
MLRKNIRMRREYLFNMEQEKKAKQKYEQKIQVKNAIAMNKSIPTELYKESENLKKEIQTNDINTISKFFNFIDLKKILLSRIFVLIFYFFKVPRNHIDDEYATAEYREPMILITTSRDPSPRLVNFQKELVSFFPNSERMNRGQTVVKELSRYCIQKNVTDLVILHEHRGEPDGMIITHFPLGPTLYLGIKNVVLRHDLKNEKLDAVSKQNPHLIFNNFNTPLGERITSILKHLFPVPKHDSKKVITFSNNSDLISVRHHVHDKVDYKTVDLIELGPRFELKPYQISLGTLDQTEATKEWVLRPYMNTATTRQAF